MTPLDPDFPPRPIERSFWVAPGLLGGAYPGDIHAATARRKLQDLADAGVTMWLDLTTVDDGLAPYEELLIARREQALRHVSMPVPDLTAAPDEVIEQALAAIDDEIDRGGTVYVHCWGGKGRTGTILGCYLARTLGGEEALITLNRRRDAQVTHPPDVGVPVPETNAQRDVVRRWTAAGHEPG